MVNGVVAAAAFGWLGLVVGVSFLETPLKFRAPGITLQLGLGIGRLVFAALHRVEIGLLALLALALVLGAPTPAMVWSAATVAGLLGVQLVLVRPALVRRSDRVLAGEDGPRSRAHLNYIVLEVGKVVALTALGVFALGAR